MAKKKSKSKSNSKYKSKSLKHLRFIQRMILSTTILLISGLVIVGIGWIVGDNFGLWLIGFGSALLFISAVLYWDTTEE